MDALLRKEMKQIKEEKDNKIRNITEKYETTTRTLRTELKDSSQQIESLKAQKVNMGLCVIFIECIKILHKCIKHHLSY